MIINNFTPSQLKPFFTNKTREMCKFCKRYGKIATCPPYVDSVEYYRELLPTYQHGQFIIIETAISFDRIYGRHARGDENWKSLGRKSSLELHNKLTEERLKLFSSGKLSTAFGAGSCKICKTCQFPCAFPDKSIIPIEATGLNIVLAVKRLINIDVKFPVEKYGKFLRIGVILYD